ncbi:MAG: hypothetical protein HQK53_07060 [Oligoflexia bacterium]|nr:hypothetical protein [Oligoflexia bacterium]
MNTKNFLLIVCLIFVVISCNQGNGDHPQNSEIAIMTAPTVAAPAIAPTDVTVHPAPIAPTPTPAPEDKNKDSFMEMYNHPSAETAVTIAALHSATGTATGEELYNHLTTHNKIDLTGKPVTDLSILRPINNIESITLEGVRDGVIETAFSN